MSLEVVPAPHAPPQIPTELYRNIADNLHNPIDNKTLRSLSLVSRAWWAESRRILFINVGDLNSGPRCSDDSHILFLMTIIRNPTTLGPIVQAYSQLLRCDPHSPAEDPSQILWQLTMQALPLLVNLKHLSLQPRPDRNGPSPPPPYAYMQLNRCTFSLTSLKWCFSRDASGTDDLIQFLRGQHALEHLEIGPNPQYENLSWFPDDVCPNLMSISCAIHCAPRVLVTHTKLVSLSGCLSDLFHGRSTRVRAPRYLRLAFESWNPARVRMNFDNMIVLELSTRHLSAIKQLLPNMPKLRVMALVGIHKTSDVQMQAAISCFRQCATLEYLIVGDTIRPGKRTGLRKMTLASPRHGGYNAETDIRSEEFHLQEELGKPWWTAYGLE